MKTRHFLITLFLILNCAVVWGKPSEVVALADVNVCKPSILDEDNAKKIAESSKDWRKALEISMYYMGWSPEDISFRYKKNALSDELNYIPTTKEMRISPKIRDAEKAFEWAKKSHEFQLSKRDFSSNTSLYYLTLFYLEGIGTEKDFDKLKHTEKLFETYAAEYPFPNRDAEFGAIFAYIYYYGKGGFEKDISLCNFYISQKLSPLVWRNFYCGYMVPKDREFAKYILMFSAKYYDFEALTRIHEGFYDASDKDDTKAKYWKERAAKKKEALKHKEWGDIFYTGKGWSSYCAPKKIIRMSLGDIVEDNPYYDSVKGVEAIKSLIENADSKPKALEIFAENAWRLGIEKKFVDQFLSGLKSTKYDEKKLESMSSKLEYDYSREQAPDYSDYY